MHETTDDLRATAESIAADAEQLKDVEQAAADAVQDGRKLVELNTQSERLVEEIAAKGAMQSALVAEAATRA